MASAGRVCGGVQRLLAWFVLTQLASASTVPPFYVYDGPEFDWLANCTKSHPEAIKEYRHDMAGVPLHFLHAALDHPSRVYDVSDPGIVVYIIPVLAGFAINNKGCLGHSVEEMLETTGAAILASPAYQKRQGSDHFMVDFGWRATQWNYTGSFETVINSVALGVMESWLKIEGVGGSRGSCRVVLPYIAHFSQHKPEPFYDFFFMGGAQEQRLGYRTRVNGGKLIRESNLSYAFIVSDYPGTKVNFPDDCDYAVCEAKRRCGPCRAPFNLKRYRDFLSKSRFSLIIRGDTLTTSRLYDAIGAGVVPVLISDGISYLGLPFTGTVSWPDLALTLPEDFVLSDLHSLNATSQRLYQAKQAAVERHKRDLLWNIPGSRVFGNTLRHVATYCVSADQLAYQ